MIESLISETLLLEKKLIRIVDIVEKILHFNKQQKVKEFKY